jgi:hypothetical protein
MRYPLTSHHELVARFVTKAVRHTAMKAS